MKSKKLIDYAEEIDINLALISSELDTEPNRLKYFDNKDKDLTPEETEDFEEVFKLISNEGNFISSINDNTELFEWGDESTIIILYTFLEQHMIIVDTEDVKEVKRIFKHIRD